MIFRRIGPDGQVYFSDQLGPDAERVDVTPAQTISLPSVSEQSETEAAETQSDATIEVDCYIMKMRVKPPRMTSQQASPATLTSSTRATTREYGLRS